MLSASSTLSLPPPPPTPRLHQSQPAGRASSPLFSSRGFSVTTTNAALSSAPPTPLSLSSAPPPRLLSLSLLCPPLSSPHGCGGVQVPSAGTQLRSAVFTLDGSLRPGPLHLWSSQGGAEAGLCGLLTAATPRTHPHPCLPPSHQPPFLSFSRSTSHFSPHHFCFPFPCSSTHARFLFSQLPQRCCSSAEEDER